MGATVASSSDAPPQSVQRGLSADALAFVPGLPYATPEMIRSDSDSLSHKRSHYLALHQVQDLLNQASSPRQVSSSSGRTMLGRSAC